MKPKTLQIHLQKELSRLYDAHEAAAIATRYVTDRFGLSTAQLLLKCRCNKWWDLNGFAVIVFG